MEKTHHNHQKAFINKALVELKRRPDKLNLVKINIKEHMSTQKLSKPTYRHLEQLKWIIESNNITTIEDWLNHSERNPKGYQNWALAFKNLF